MYDGEVNAKKLYNRVRQIEVYCRVQKVVLERKKIQLASLRLGGTALVWWEGKTQEDLKNHGKIISTWNEFVSTIKKKFNPLAYMQQAMMSWQTLRQLKGPSVQSYTQELRKRALTQGISLDSPETLLKYIGGLHSYLRHTILMLNPTSLDDVFVQATHLEARGKNVTQDVGKSSKPIESKNKGKKKLKWKENKTNTVKKDKPSCTHCKKEGHDEPHYCSLHLELKPKKIGSKERKNASAIQKDLGSDSGDETTITTTGIKGKYSKASTSTSSHSVDNDNDERKINELFHIRVISQHTKIDTLFHSGSQVNLIF